MRIVSVENGFIEFIDNSIVEKVICNYDSTCVVCFRDKTTKTLKVSCSSYNRQYGFPVSIDGTKLFVGNWEKGLFAYDIISGEEVWRFKTSRVRNVLVFSDFLVVSRAYKAVDRIDIETGKLNASIKSGTLEHVFNLGFPYVFADTISGKYSIIDVAKMAVIERINSKTINPHNCLSLMIEDVKHLGKTILVSGIEDYPQKHYIPSLMPTGKAFSREIEIVTNRYNNN